MAALAEVVWSPKMRKNWEDFAGRLQKQYRRYDAMDAHYRIPTPTVTSYWALATGDTLRCRPGVDGADIRYTTDGSDPREDSPLFKELQVSDHFILKMQTVLANGRASSIITQPILVTDKASEGRYFGLDYVVYTGEIGPFMPAPAGLKKYASGSTFTLDLNDISHPDDQFYVVFTGDLMIPQAGTYAFYIHGDDGAKLSIDGKLVAGHDTYSGHSVMGNVQLSAGPHPVKVEYFEHRGSERLTLEIEGVGLKRQGVLPWMWQSEQKGGEE
jgi:hypothetical protein